MWTWINESVSLPTICCDGELRVFGKVCEQEMESQEILFWVVQSVMKIINILLRKNVP